MRETWAVGPEKQRRFRRRERPQRLSRVDWGWLLFVLVYLACGAAILWFAAQAMDGTL